MSCDPASLARDLAHLSLGGFEPELVRPFDMIPHSDAVESLVVLRRGAPRPPAILHEASDFLVALKSGYETLTSELGQCSLLERVRRLPGWGSAEPAQLLDREASGVCLFAKQREALPALQRALADGKQVFLGLARGVTHKKGRIKRTVKQRGQTLLSETHYQRTHLCAGHSELTIEPNSRAPERIRQHLASVGHPLLGDASQGDEASNRFFLHRHGLDRSYLHCASLTVTTSDGPLTLTAPLPGELQAVRRSASKKAATRGE